MARNRNNSTADFLKMFQTTYGLTRGIQKDSDMAGIAKATPEESQGFTAEDGQQLEAIANAKKPDGTPYYSVTPGEGGGYQVGSNFETQNAAGQMETPAPAAFAQRGVTDFLGKRQSGSMTDAQVLGARQQAMAGVMEKYGDATGAMQFRQQAALGLRQDAAEVRAAETHVTGQAEQAQRGILTGQNIEVGKDNAAQRGRDEINRLLTVKTQGDEAAFDLKNRTGADGVVRERTAQDHLDGTKRMEQAYRTAGNQDMGDKLNAQYEAGVYGKIRLETAKRDEAFGVAASQLAIGNTKPLIDAYNQYVPDGAQITKMTPNGKGAFVISRVGADGKPMPDKLTSMGELVSGISAFKNPNAVYEFTRNERADKRADDQLGVSQAAGGRAQAEFVAGGSERQLKSTVATLQLGLANTDDPVQQQAIQAKLAAIQGGLGGDKNAPSEVKLASAMLKAGMAPDMRSALEMAVTRKSNSPDEIHQGFVSAGLKNMTPAAQSVKAADEVMASMGFSKKNGRWTQGQGGNSDSSAPAGPAKGAVLNGFEFQGGNPNDKKNWRQVSSGNVN